MAKVWIKGGFVERYGLGALTRGEQQDPGWEEIGIREVAASGVIAVKEGLGGRGYWRMENRISKYLEL